MFIGVNQSGALRDCAYTEFQERYEAHPDTGVVFEGYAVPEVPKILNAVRSVHARIPQLGMISWDITVGSEGYVVIIEMNLNGQSVWLSQMPNGQGAFGDDTAAILRWISGKE